MKTRQPRPDPPAFLAAHSFVFGSRANLKAAVQALHDCRNDEKLYLRSHNVRAMKNKIDLCLVESMNLAKELDQLLSLAVSTVANKLCASKVRSRVSMRTAQMTRMAGLIECRMARSLRNIQNLHGLMKESCGDQYM